MPLGARRIGELCGGQPEAYFAPMTESLVGPTLLTARSIEAEIGVLVRYQVVDKATGILIGRARRGTLWDLEGRPAVQLVGRDENGWAVVESRHEPVGWIRPASETHANREVLIEPRPPYGWTGWIRLAREDRDVARIRSGQVTDLRTKQTIAVLGVPPKETGYLFNEFGHQRHHGLWTMKFGDNASRPLRIMALAWLLYAWRMQRTIDQREASAD
jgi:hypothetical protein